jgi:hypothetical protein
VQELRAREKLDFAARRAGGQMGQTEKIVALFSTLTAFFS